MPLHDAVGIHCKNGATAEMTAQMSSIWAKGFMFDDRVRFIRLNTTTPPWWREKVIFVYYLV